MKYAYRLALISGLRVSELGALKASDLHFNDSDGKIIHVDVKHGKGGSNGCVECLPDAYLYEHLQKFTKEHPEGNLFYSEAHMRKEADRLQLECHDFRRIFSQQLYSKLKAETDLEQRKSMRPSRNVCGINDFLLQSGICITVNYALNHKGVILHEQY